MNEAQARAELEAWERALWVTGGRLFGAPSGPAPLLHGVYLPYWSFDWDVTTAYVASRSAKDPADSPKTVRTVFARSTVLASRTVPMAIGADLEPWDLENVVAPRSELFSGLRAETHAVGDGLARGALLSHRLLDREVDHAIQAGLSGQEVVRSKHATYHAVAVRLLLLPVWVMSYRQKGATYRVLVNGRNGETVGERPFDRFQVLMIGVAPWVLPLIAATGSALAHAEERAAFFVMALWGAMLAQAITLVVVAGASDAPRRRRQGQFFMHREGDNQSDNFAELWSAAVVQQDRWARRRVLIQAGVFGAFLSLGPLGMTALLRANGDVSGGWLVVFAHLWVAVGVGGIWFSWRMASKEKRYFLGLTDDKP